MVNCFAIKQPGVSLDFKTRILSRIRKSNGQDIVFPDLHIAALNDLVDHEILHPEISVKPEVPAHEKFVWIDLHRTTFLGFGFAVALVRRTFGFSRGGLT
jgi:hypothetical protein